MKNRISILLATAILLPLLVGCEEPFTPKGPYTDRMVVYGILSTRSDTQFVRVYSTYNPEGFDPLQQTQEVVIRGATITISDAVRSFQFRECVIPRTDKSRYPDDIAGYRSTPFALEPGKTYNLTIASDRFGSASAAVTVPKRARLQVLNAYVLNGGGAEDENIVVFGWIRELTYGVVLRMYLDYETQEGNVWVRRLQEIPQSMKVHDDGTVEYFYPSLNRRVSRATVVDKELNETFVFYKKAYFNLVDNLYSRYRGGRLRLKSALVILTQFERNLYTYSKLARAFEDPYSIRTDAPDYSNIKGGVGIFGAMVEDSLAVELTL